ncbi:MAG: heavy metal-binding domain-containing protein [Wenzhouxiangellaceae bacterium]|nr:heavy metal-binding domain-containing protein [Wenzhouxiangellaceae bacterium]
MDRVVPAQTMNRMFAQAEKQGADAVVGIRFVTAQIGQGSAELVAYGTAVKMRSSN